MSSANQVRPWDRFRDLSNSHDRKGLESFLSTLEMREVVRSLLRLSLEEQGRVLTVLSPDKAADIIEEMPDEQAADTIEKMEPKEAAKIVNLMASDEQADLLGDLHAAEAEAILLEMAPEEVQDARALTRYADDIAGGLMITEYLRYGEGAFIGDVIDDLATRANELTEHFTRYAYVISSWKRLVGVVEVRDIALTTRTQRLAQIMVPSQFIKAEATLDELKSLFEMHSFAAIPVVSENGELLGIVQRTAVYDALEERAEREMLRMRGIVGGDEIRTLPVFERSYRRLSWLSVNIVLNIVAASVIALYIDTLGAVIALAVFLPIISDMSGCSGNQAVAVSMRELALDITKPYEVLLVWMKEISVGALNGAALGLLLGGVAWMWDGNPYLGLVVGSALAINTLIAVSIGGTVPLLLKRFRIDPAVASGPILTTVTDICGFFLVLSLATLMLGKLV